MQIQLLGTSGCHLCDVAERMVRRIAPPLGFAIELVDIAEDDHLVEQYGMAIPVLTCGEQQLGWPFAEEQLTQWLQTLAQ